MTKNTRNSFSKSDISQVEKVILTIVRILFAATFIFSGFVKAVDPLGLTYKMQEYLIAFGEFFTNFTSLALPFAIILITVELVIGLNLLFKVYVKYTLYIALLFMCVMTPLTLYTVIANPVSDCGCFGDALKISNPATFAKNVVLLAFVIYMLVRQKYIRSLFMPAAQAVVALFFVAAGIGICVYCYTHLPLIDFIKPYKVGVNLAKAMEIPEGAPHDVYETSFIFEKNGEQKEFTLDNYPKEDSTWTFVDQKTKLITQGYIPLIHDFEIINPENGDDHTDDVIYSQGKVYLVVMYDLNKSSLKGVKKIEELYKKSVSQGIPFYVLTGSSADTVKKFVSETGVTFPFYETDATTLKTIIRANPGLVTLESGTIVDKVNWRDIK